MELLLLAQRAFSGMDAITAHGGAVDGSNHLQFLSIVRQATVALL